jgi:hypothetical protein
MVLSKPPSVSLTLKRPPLSLPVPLSKKAKEDCEQKQKIHVLEEDEENLFSSAHNNGNLSMFILLLYYFTLFYLYYFIKVI